jgi:hypothetical protein
MALKPSWLHLKADGAPLTPPPAKPASNADR